MDESFLKVETNSRYSPLVMPEDDSQDLGTLYKLRLSMKRRLSPQGVSTPSPQGAAELRSLLRLLVEIDNQSRELLKKVFSLLEKDDKLEKYIKKRIEDPKVSRMWELVEQVLACQEDHTKLDELIMSDESFSSGSGVTDKGVNLATGMDEETKLDRFKVRNLDSSGGVKIEGTM